MKSVTSFLVTLGCTLFLGAAAWGVARDPNFEVSLGRSKNIDLGADKKRVVKVGERVTINGNGRLWLTGEEDMAGYYELLCQNRTSGDVEVEITSGEFPWLTVASPENCASWTGDLLVCPAYGQAKGVFCKVSKKAKQSLINLAMRAQTASVGVRSIEMAEDQEDRIDYNAYLLQMIVQYQTGIELCGAMHGVSGPVVIAWNIYDGGTTGKVDVDKEKSDPRDLGRAQCIAEQIEDWRFPKWKKDYRVAYRF